MPTDVKLDQADGTFLHLEARVVKTIGSDFMLDAPERHTGVRPFRRALVHDQGDGLTVNFAGDYPGGVTLNGVRELSPHQPPRSKTEFALLDPTPILALRGGLQFEVHSQSPLSVGSDSGAAKVVTFSLHGELKKLENQILALAARVAVLEKK
jgi:hypothetical protein